MYHIWEFLVQAWSIAAFHRRPRPPQCLESVFNAMKLLQISCETGNNLPPRDQSSCPSIASECQQMAETSSFLSKRRRYLFPLYLTLSSSLTNCLKRSKLIIGPLCLLLKIVYRQAKKMFLRSSGGQFSRPKSLGPFSCRGGCPPRKSLRPENRSFVLQDSLYLGVFPFQFSLSKECN